MSHISKIEVEIKDLEDLKKACARLGIEFDENQRTFRWYAGQRQCECAIKVPGAQYEIGVIKEGGKYCLLWDDFSAGGLRERLAKGAGKLKQAYAVERIRKEAILKGYRCNEAMTENGIRLRLTVP